ncbi:MAG: hypothetical protein M3R06_02730, partial [Chloroflexota bacterium]|nr:hypothetical protein [Chloroflexota bacterium]
MRSATRHFPTRTSRSIAIARNVRATDWILFWTGATAMVGASLGFTWRYPLLGNTDVLTDIGIMSNYAAPAFISYLVGLSFLFGGYLVAVHSARHLPTGQVAPPVFAIGALLGGIFAGMYPVNAIDIFIYAVRSRIWTEYGLNPNAVRPDQFWNDPYMQFASPAWAGEVSPYGPLWNLIAAPGTWLGGDRIATALLFYKLLAVFAVIATGLVIYRTLLATRPTNAAAGALFFLWNPLVLWEGIGNGHNDVLIALLIAAAAFAWVKRAYALVIPILVAATAIKYITLLLIPLAIVAIWRILPTWHARARAAIASAILSFGIALVALYPFYEIGALVDSVDRQSALFATSPAAVAVDQLRAFVGKRDARSVVVGVGTSLLVFSAIVLLVSVWRRPDRLIRAWFEMLFVFLALATWNFRGWYLIWLIAGAALLPFGWPAVRMVTWVAGNLAAYSLFIWIWAWWEVDFATIQNVAVPIMFTAPLLLTAVELARRIGPNNPRS